MRSAPSATSLSARRCASLTTPDAPIHIGLAASLRAGAFPPELPWNPGASAPYHYGMYLLNGLLAPPSGPNLAFVEELLGAYAWISLVAVVLTVLLRRASGFAMLIVIPLLLTPGGWTLMFNEPLSILEVPVPAGLPSAGLRASLTDTYWPSLGLPLNSQHEMPPNIWTPSFTVSYALAFVVLARAAHAGRRSWPTVLTLGALVGFIGLTAIALVPIVLVLWAGVEAIHLIQSRRARSVRRSDVLRPAAGLALAAMLLLAGGFSTLFLGDSVASGLSLGWNEHLGRWRLLGTFDRLPGGMGILGLGPLAVAGAAVLLAWRERLVQALAAASGFLLLAALPLSYEPLPRDLVRFEGHARNFALLALLLALGIRLTGLPRARWRYAAGAAVFALIIWPTAAAPARNLGLAVGSGFELANAQPPQQRRSFFEGRFSLKSLPSDRIASYIHNNTAVDARMFSPYPDSMTYATGRPNASGFAGLIHLFSTRGPEYQDVLRYLEPAAVRRIGFEYVHAPDEWVDGLPDEAAARLNDPRLFELLVRDGSESLYRVLPAFLKLDAPPAPAADGRIAFTATFNDRAAGRWTSQDWIMIATEVPPWDLPTQLLHDGTPAIAMWFVSHLNPGKGTSSLAYEFDFLAPSLAVRREHGALKPLDRSEAVLGSDSYVLAVRLRHEYQPGYWRDAAIIPVLKITVSETGEVLYRVHQDAGGESAR